MARAILSKKPIKLLLALLSLGANMVVLPILDSITLSGRAKRRIGIASQTLTIALAGYIGLNAAERVLYLVDYYLYDLAEMSSFFIRKSLPVDYILPT